jgi:hypothetical protein
MIPKDKAHQLVTRFYLALPNNGSQTGINNVHQRWEEGRMCAMMAVDEILFITDEEEQYILYKHWQEVKQEIENID